MSSSLPFSTVKHGYDILTDKSGTRIECGYYENGRIQVECSVPRCELNAQAEAWLTAEEEAATLLFPNGAYYIGSLDSKNHPHGYGKKYDKNNKLIFEGESVHGFSSNFHEHLVKEDENDKQTAASRSSSSCSSVKGMQLPLFHYKWLFGQFWCHITYYGFSKSSPSAGMDACKAFVKTTYKLIVQEIENNKRIIRENEKVKNNNSNNKKIQFATVASRRSTDWKKNEREFLYYHIWQVVVETGRMLTIEGAVEGEERRAAFLNIQKIASNIMNWMKAEYNKTSGDVLTMFTSDVLVQKLATFPISSASLPSFMKSIATCCAYPSSDAAKREPRPPHLNRIATNTLQRLSKVMEFIFSQDMKYGKEYGLTIREGKNNNSNSKSTTPFHFILCFVGEEQRQESSQSSSPSWYNLNVSTSIVLKYITHGALVSATEELSGANKTRIRTIANMIQKDGYAAAYAFIMTEIYRDSPSHRYKKSHTNSATYTGSNSIYSYIPAYRYTSCCDYPINNSCGVIIRSSAKQDEADALVCSEHKLEVCKQCRVDETEYNKQLQVMFDEEKKINQHETQSSESCSSSGITCSSSASPVSISSPTATTAAASGIPSPTAHGKLIAVPLDQVAAFEASAMGQHSVDLSKLAEKDFVKFMEQVQIQQQLNEEEEEEEGEEQTTTSKHKQSTTCSSSHTSASASSVASAVAASSPPALNISVSSSTTSTSTICRSSTIISASSSSSSSVPLPFPPMSVSSFPV